jgi:drug/metabolite transporter (DMT)-like permease
MLFIGTGAVIWVEQYLPSGVVAITVSSSPVWFVLFDKRNWSKNLSSKATMGGMIIGFAGVILLFSENFFNGLAIDGHQTELAGMALLVIASMSWAWGSLYSKYKMHTGSATVNSAWQMLAAGLAFLPFSSLRGEHQQFHWQNVSAGAWFSLFYLVIFGSIIGFSAYVWLLKVRPAAQVSTHSYVNPVVAVLLGIFFGNESISWVQILGLAIIITAVLMINLAKYREEKSKSYDLPQMMYDVEVGS